MASITDDVVEGLKYPFNDIKKVLIFGVLFAMINVISLAISEISVNIFRTVAVTPGDSLSFNLLHLPGNDIYIIALLAIVSFIISLFIMGYQYDVISFSIERKNDLPEFSDILGLFIKGAKYFAVTLIYNIIPIIVLAIGVGLISFQSYGYYWIMVISAILFIICNFLLIMALANMVDTGKISKAFDLREITDKIANLGWVKYIGIILFTFIIYAIIMVAIGMILMFISMFIAIAINQAMVVSAIVTIIEGLFISSYMSIFVSRVYGSIYREAIK